MKNNKIIGGIGEELAAKFLISNGFDILDRNPTSRWGELDIVAEKSHIIYFVEVKTRISTRQGSPYEAVSGMKLRHLQRTIQYYILSHNLQKRQFQLDIISVELNADRSVKNIKRYEDVSFV